MAECGIKKYDTLPARVGIIDVDELRWRLYRCDNPSWVSKVPIIGMLLAPPTDQETRSLLIRKLEQARKHCSKKSNKQQVKK